MNTTTDRIDLITEAAKRLHKPVFDGKQQPKEPAPRTDKLTNSYKVVSLEEAIRRSGLKDGMTISFHHHFRAGDKVVNMVVAKLAEMGYKDLHLAASSLIDVHEPLIEHIRNG
ncbi:MAG: citrate lyase subunit alpha, partial [Prevotella sp.]|nr:citrate lyase subunit alpha [Prevotella sp.]